MNSTVPWHNLHFLFARSQLSALLADNCCIIPASVSLKAIAVDFDHLYKIRSAVGDNCEGFSLASFDRLIRVGVCLLLTYLLSTDAYRVFVLFFCIKCFYSMFYIVIIIK